MTIKTITVKYLNTPKEGKKRGSIKTTENDFFGIWPNQIALFEVGKTYDIEVEEKNGFTNVKSVKLVASAEPAPGVLKPAGNGYNNYREMSAKDAEGSFVCATLGALIRAGEVKNDKAQLWATTNMLRALWLHTFGQPAVPAKEVAQG